MLKRRWRWWQYVLLLCLAGFPLFHLMFYVQWGMWSASKYTVDQGCTEKIYNIPPRKLEEIYRDCNLQNKQDDARFTIANHTVIRIKCGYVTATLVSPKKYRPCLNNLHLHRPSSEFIVPNTVHYINFGQINFTFLNYLSVFSSSKFIKPRAIFLHGDSLPYGPWWEKLLLDVPCIYFVPRDRPMRLQGVVIPWIEHSADITRLQTLLDNGGIYLDMDILVVQSFDPLRKYSAVIGRETPRGLNSGIILAEPGAPYLCTWLQHAYQTYNPYPWNWGKFTVWKSHDVAQNFPDSVRVEGESLQLPGWFEAEKLFDGLYDWSGNFAVHVWKRFGDVPNSPEEADGLDTTLGQVIRYILYNSTVLRGKADRKRRTFLGFNNFLNFIERPFLKAGMI